MLQGDSNIDPQNQLELTGYASVNLRSSVVVVGFFFASLAWEGKKADSRDNGRGHDRRLRLCPLDYLGQEPINCLGKLWQFEFKRDIYSFSMVIDSFQWWLVCFFFFNFRVELNLSLAEARRKAHNKPINTFSGWHHAGERLRNLWTIDRAATQHCSSLFPLL